jgi:hypothetical protein
VVAVAVVAEAEVLVALEDDEEDGEKAACSSVMEW